MQLMVTSVDTEIDGDTGGGIGRLMPIERPSKMARVTGRECG